LKKLKFNLFYFIFLEILIDDQELTINLNNALFKAAKETQTRLINSMIDIEFSGSTLLVLFIKDCKLAVLNVGDSRAVVGKKSLVKKIWEQSPLSKDHKPENLEENLRIVKAGGRIEKFKDLQGKESGPTRVWFSKDNSYGISMSRSLGDTIAKNYGVTWEPGLIKAFYSLYLISENLKEIKEFDLEDEIKFIVLGSDGLWEVLDNSEVFY